MVLVSGWTGAMDAVVSSLLTPGTVAVRHDLSRVTEGVVRRTLSVSGESPRETILELAHGCVSCTLREDLLPLLRALSMRSNVHRIVLAMDPALEPEALCWAVENVVVAGVVGQIDGPAARDVRIEAVIGCLDAATWLADATGDDALADRGVVASGDDDRTVAQLVVGQVDYATAVSSPQDPMSTRGSVPGSRPSSRGWHPTHPSSGSRRTRWSTRPRCSRPFLSTPGEVRSPTPTHRCCAVSRR